MNSGFTKGLVVGGVIGAALSMMMEPGMMKGRTRRKIMRAKKDMMRRTGSIIGGVVDLFR